jgi:hypothetical protein
MDLGLEGPQARRLKRTRRTARDSDIFASP